MASVDSQNYSPILEKKNFKDLLEEDMVAVEEDLITKIFSQTIQVSPSDETAEGYDDIRVNDSTDTESKNGEDQLADIAPEEQFDKVPTDFSHFNRTIIDLDETDYDQEIDVDKLSHTPSTASPVDEQSEIRDFEEIERITSLTEVQDCGRGADSTSNAENSENDVIDEAMEVQEEPPVVDEISPGNDDEIRAVVDLEEDPEVDAVDNRLPADADPDVCINHVSLISV